MLSFISFQKQKHNKNQSFKEKRVNRKLKLQQNKIILSSPINKFDFINSIKTHEKTTKSQSTKTRIFINK